MLAEPHKYSAIGAPFSLLVLQPHFVMEPGEVGGVRTAAPPVGDLHTGSVMSGNVPGTVRA
jgi:hypothetical protein